MGGLPSLKVALRAPAHRNSSYLQRPGKRLLRTTIAAVAVGLAVLSVGSAVTEARTADHLMCDWKVSARPQSVSIDPDLSQAGLTYEDVIEAFKPWNRLATKYHGFPIFVVHHGNWYDADILLTAHGGARTWVNTTCNPGFVQRGQNHSIVFVGPQDAWRNRQMLSHELGHALGFADHGQPAEQTSGHVGFKLAGDYIGVMSYSTSPQSWFLDLGAPGITDDGELIKDFWRN